MFVTDNKEIYEEMTANGKSGVLCSDESIAMEIVHKLYGEPPAATCDCDCEACCGIDLDDEGDEGAYCPNCGELWEDCDCCLSGEDDDRGYGDSVWRGWIK